MRKNPSFAVRVSRRPYGTVGRSKRKTEHGRRIAVRRSTLKIGYEALLRPVVYGCFVLLGGGNWNNSTSCGSRALDGNNSRATCNANYSARGLIRKQVSVNFNSGWFHSPVVRKGGKIQNEAVAVAGRFAEGAATDKKAEMKRYGNLWDDFISKENFLEAYENAKKGKSKLPSVQRFSIGWQDRLETLRLSVLNGEWKHGDYVHKTIYEPKERQISIANFEDRIIHWAVTLIIEPIFAPTFINTAFACRKGFGQHKASLKVSDYVRRYKYCFKFDHSKFYPTMNHAYLKECVRQKIKDERLLTVIDGIIDSVQGDAGVPIGNLTSQIFGNIYRTPLDHYIKQELGCSAYLNYMDDGLIFGDDSAELHKIEKAVRAFVEDKQKQRLSKADIFPCTRGVDALGYRHFKKYLLLRKRTAKRLKRRIKSIPARMETGELSIEGALGKVSSAIGLIKHGCCHNLAENLKVYELHNDLKRLKNGIKKI